MKIKHVFPIWNIGDPYIKGDMNKVRKSIENDIQFYDAGFSIDAKKFRVEGFEKWGHVITANKHYKKNWWGICQNVNRELAKRPGPNNFSEALRLNWTWIVCLTWNEALYPNPNKGLTRVFSIIEFPNQQVLLAVLPHALHGLSES